MPTNTSYSKGWKTRVRQPTDSKSEGVLSSIGGSPVAQIMLEFSLMVEHRNLTPAMEVRLFQFQPARKGTNKI